MGDRTEAKQICADILRDYRLRAGLSKSRMADLLYITERTYTRYETGESSPPLEDFLRMLELIDVPALPTILRYVYPEVYDGLCPSSRTSDIRNAVSHFVSHSMSDKGVRELAYILNGEHGSTVEAQLQLFCAYEHLPLDARLTIAKLIYNLWEIEDARGSLVNTEFVMPDIELLHQALIKATAAVIEHRKTYAAVIKEGPDS